MFQICSHFRTHDRLNDPVLIRGTGPIFVGQITLMTKLRVSSNYSSHSMRSLSRLFQYLWINRKNLSGNSRSYRISQKEPSALPWRNDSVKHCSTSVSSPTNYNTNTFHITIFRRYIYTENSKRGNNLIALNWCILFFTDQQLGTVDNACAELSKRYYKKIFNGTICLWKLFSIIFYDAS